MPTRPTDSFTKALELDNELSGTETVQEWLKYSLIEVTMKLLVLQNFHKQPSSLCIAL